VFSCYFVATQQSNQKRVPQYTDLRFPSVLAKFDAQQKLATLRRLFRFHQILLRSSAVYKGFKRCSVILSEVCDAHEVECISEKLRHAEFNQSD